MGSIADLAVTLNNTIINFNKHNDMAEVLAVMAPGFTAVSLRPQMEFGPATAPSATQELNAQSDATFQLIGAPVFAPPAGDVLNAQITGQALWKDPVKPAGDKIQFKLDCIFDPIQKKWFFQNLMGGVV